MAREKRLINDSKTEIYLPDLNIYSTGKEIGKWVVEDMQYKISREDLHKRIDEANSVYDTVVQGKKKNIEVSRYYADYGLNVLKSLTYIRNKVFIKIGGIIYESINQYFEYRGITPTVLAQIIDNEGYLFLEADTRGEGVLIDFEALFNKLEGYFREIGFTGKIKSWGYYLLIKKGYMYADEDIESELPFDNEELLAGVRDNVIYKELPTLIKRRDTMYMTQAELIEYAIMIEQYEKSGNKYMVRYDTVKQELGYRIRDNNRQQDVRKGVQGTLLKLEDVLREYANERTPEGEVKKRELLNKVYGIKYITYGFNEYVRGTHKELEWYKNNRNCMMLKEKQIELGIIDSMEDSYVAYRGRRELDLSNVYISPKGGNLSTLEYEDKLYVSKQYEIAGIPDNYTGVRKRILEEYLAIKRVEMVSPPMLKDKLIKTKQTSIKVKGVYPDTDLGKKYLYLGVKGERVSNETANK